MRRQRQSRTSTSKFRQSFRELIRLSLIPATHMLTLPNGRQKQKILLQDSLRTSRNMRATNLEKRLLQQARRSKFQIEMTELKTRRTVRRVRRVFGIRTLQIEIV